LALAKVFLLCLISVVKFIFGCSVSRIKNSNIPSNKINNIMSINQDSNELSSMAQMFGATQSFSDQGLIAMLCPELEGKTMQELTPEEFQQLLAAANANFPVVEIEDED
jgi:hypothetical protein